MPILDSSVVVEDNSFCGVEGSNITYYCQPGLVPSERSTAYCMPNGSWSPSPSDLMCTSIAETTFSSPNPGSHNNIIV